MASPPTASQEAVAQVLANDRPTIDSAVKSFVSLAAARVMGDSVTVANQQSSNLDALKQARFLLKAVNNYTFPLKRDPSEEYKTVAQIWNGLIASQQKPSRYLGRIALVHAWNNGLPEEIDEEGREFSDEFGSLLLQYTSTEIPVEDCDACLLWDEDKGQAELSRRRQRRAERAREQHEREQQTTIPMIEELPNEDDDDEEGAELQSETQKEDSAKEE